MSVPFYALDKPGEKGVVLGNEGIARGVLEAGIQVASGYPGTPSSEIMEKVHAVLEAHPGVRDFHAVRARTMGGFVEMDCHILVNPGLSVREGHEIARDVKRSIMAGEESIVNVVVHVEPLEKS